MVVGLVSMGVPKGAARHMYWYSSWSLGDAWGGHWKVLHKHLVFLQKVIDVPGAS